MNEAVLEHLICRSPSWFSIPRTMISNYRRRLPQQPSLRLTNLYMRRALGIFPADPIPGYTIPREHQVGDKEGPFFRLREAGRATKGRKTTTTT